MDALTAIRASKLFKASKHQSRIYAAMIDPINKELVQQLDSYIDDDDESKSERYEEESEHAEKKNSKEYKNTSSKGESGSKSDISHTTTSKANSMTKPEESSSESTPPESHTEEAEVEKSKEESSSKNNEVEESKSIKSSKEFMSNIDNVSSSLDAIKGLLNANGSTSGVLRLQIKENELWCYYQDSVNMNDMMNDVINLLIASGYPYLEFNRLARSDNAMVFEITQSSTVEPTSISDEEE